MTRKDILVKKETLELLDDLFGVLDSREDDINTTWGDTGEIEQKTEWDKETKSMVKVFDDDDGNPVMTAKYGTIPKKADEFTDEDKAKLAAIKTIKTALEKLI